MANFEETDIFLKDNTFLVWEHNVEALNTFLSKINASDKEKTFLDILIHIYGDTSETNIHRKMTHKIFTLSISLKRASIQFQFDQALKITVL